MMKNRQYLFKFSDFFISLLLFRRKIIVFCPSVMILTMIAATLHKLLKKKTLGVGGVNGHQFAII